MLFVTFLFSNKIHTYLSSVSYMFPCVRIVYLHPDAKQPILGTPLSVGYDLYAVNIIHDDKLNLLTVSTGIALGFDQGLYAQICPRSSLAVNYGIEVLAGIIDEDYRGEIKVILKIPPNWDWENHILIGDRVAQLIFKKAIRPEFQDVTSQGLSPTVRRTGGFGSTNK